MKLQITAIAMMTLATAAMAQAPAAPTGQKTLAATINVYVFPTAGQDAAKQSTDEAECYSYAVQSTGTDPFELAKQADAAKQSAEASKAQTAQATQGAGAKSAVKGAAAGALIGEIASDDAGKGAAYGAAAGVIAGRSRARGAKQQAAAQADQQVAQASAATAEGTANFKKAFSVCLEAKKYMVKF
jgi:hypothetical protein